MEIHNPHDKQLFNTLKNKAVAKEACRAYLPPEILKYAILEQMNLYESRKISPQNREFKADILYKIPLINGNDALMFFHMEHQSVSTKDMPLRIWQYLLLILQEYCQNNPKKVLPIVFPCILYTGLKPYTHSTNFFHLFGENKKLVESLFMNDIKMIDVCRLSDEEIKQHNLFGIAEFAFKHRLTMAFKDILDVLLPKIQNALKLNETTIHYPNDVLKYLLETMEDSDVVVFDEAIMTPMSRPMHH